MQDVLDWMFVAVSALVFAGFLFGISSALTMIEAMIRAPKTLMPQRTVRLAPARPEPRLWA